jgi:predicted RNase H-like HicB family nuclease
MLTRKGSSHYINAMTFTVLVWAATILSAGLAYAEEVGAKTAQAAPQVNSLWIYLTIVVLFIIFGGSVAFMFVVQRKYLSACIQDNQLAVFAQSPAGMPEGTVRAMISFIIITISLYLTVLLFFNVVGESKFPEALSSLLGAVVGFYFGSRTGSKDDGTGLQAQVKDLKTERDTTESNKLLVNIKKGIDMTKAVVNILPDDQKKKYTDIITKLEQGYDTVNSLTSGGSIKDALAKGQELFDIFKKDNPARDIFSKALASFSTVLGGSVPALAIITTVVGVGVKLVGTEYEKWKKRVLNVPITPAVLHLRPIDANTGFTLLLQCPIFKTAFAQELEGNDRPFMTKIMELINQPNVDDFWNTYKNRFDTREKFDQGLQELRRATLDSELAADTIDRPELFAQAGGVKEFMKSVDRINTNEEAQASLQQLVLVVEQLQKEGEPVPTIFEKVQKEMGV